MPCGRSAAAAEGSLERKGLTVPRRYVYSGSMKPDDLKRRRRELGYTQAQLAGLLKVDSMTVSRWERGVHSIPESVALALRSLKRKG